MAYQMNFNKEELAGKPPVSAGWYIVQLKGFKPKASKPKPGEAAPADPSTLGLSLNAELEIINHPEHTGRKIFAGLHTKMAFMWADFVHAAGLPMEEVQDEFAGTEKANYALPGVWEGQDTYPTEPEKWKYLGPLLNKTLEVELAEIPASGNFRAKNEIRQYKCAVAGCTEKHQTNLIFQKKD